MLKYIYMNRKKILKLYNTYEGISTLIIAFISILKKYNNPTTHIFLPSLTVLFLSLGVLIFNKRKIKVNKNITNFWIIIQSLFIWQNIYLTIIAMLILKLFNYKLNSAVFILNYFIFITLFFLDYSNTNFILLLFIVSCHYAYYINNSKLIIIPIIIFTFISVALGWVFIPILTLLCFLLIIYSAIISIQKYLIIKKINKFIFYFCIWLTTLFVISNSLISIQKLESIQNIIFNLSIVGITTFITLLMYFLFDIVYKLILNEIKFIVLKINTIYKELISSVINILFIIQNLIEKLIKIRLLKQILISKWVNTFNFPTY